MFEPTPLAPLKKEPTLALVEAINEAVNLCSCVVTAKIAAFIALSLLALLLARSIPLRLFLLPTRFSALLNLSRIEPLAAEALLACDTLARTDSAILALLVNGRDGCLLAALIESYLALAPLAAPTILSLNLDLGTSRDLLPPGG